MLTGKRFKLNRQILTVTLADGPRHAEYIPEGAILEVLGGPRPDATRLVDVRWRQIDYAVFRVDLELRGEEIKTPGE